MSYEIKNVVDQKRGCGWRKAGGLYLMSGDDAQPCNKLPIKLHICRFCGQGIKPARGWTWIDAQLIADVECEPIDECKGCNPFSTHIYETFGLIWVGGGHYNMPTDFAKEAAIMGISRRINNIPNDFNLGQTWVMLAHRRAIYNTLFDEKMEEIDANPRYFAGIFTAFRPTRIEYVVSFVDDEKKLQRLADKGVTLVKVLREETKKIFDTVNQ